MSRNNRMHKQETLENKEPKCGRKFVSLAKPMMERAREVSQLMTLITSLRFKHMIKNIEHDSCLVFSDELILSSALTMNLRTMILNLILLTSIIGLVRSLKHRLGI